MAAQFKVHGADEVADVFDDEQIEALESKFGEGFLDHNGIQVTGAAGVGHDCRNFEFFDAVNVDGDDVAFDDGGVKLFFEGAHRGKNQAGFAGAG